MNTTKRIKLTLAGCALLLSGTYGLVQATPAPAAPLADAASNYKAKCAICHGMDGSANTANGKKLAVKDLRRDEVQKMSDAQLFQIIAKGKNKMPGYEAMLGKDACTQLVAYTRQLGKK